MLHTTAALSDTTHKCRFKDHAAWKKKTLISTLWADGHALVCLQMKLLIGGNLKEICTANTHLWKLLRVSKATLRMQLLVLQKTYERKCAGCGDKSKTGFRVTSNRPTHPQPVIFHLFSPSACFYIPFLSRPTSLNKTLSQIKWTYSTSPLYI